MTFGHDDTFVTFSNHSETNNRKRDFFSMSKLKNKKFPKIEISSKRSEIYPTSFPLYAAELNCTTIETRNLKLRRRAPEKNCVSEKCENNSF